MMFLVYRYKEFGHFKNLDRLLEFLGEAQLLNDQAWEAVTDGARRTNAGVVGGKMKVAGAVAGVLKLF